MIIIIINVLIVDDEETIREGIRRNIDWENYDIRICDAVDSGFKALNIIDRNPPDIVITDIRMGEIDGLELLHIINEKYPTIKVILISAYNDFQYAQKAIELNAFYYLLKPIDSQKLLTKVLEAKSALEKQCESIKMDIDLNKKLENYIPILIDIFFTQLITGKITDIQAIKDRASFLSINLDSSQYNVLILELDDGFYNKSVSEYDKNLFKLATMNDSEKEFTNKGYSCYTFNLGDNIGILVNGNNIIIEEVLNICLQIKTWTNSSLGLLLTVAVGKVHYGISEIVLSYTEALDAFEYKFLLGKNEIIDIEKVYKNHIKSIHSNNLEELINNALNKLVTALKINNEHTITMLIDELSLIVEQAISENFKQTDRILFILSFFLVKSLLALDINMENLNIEDSNLYNQLKSLNSIIDLNPFINNYFSTIRKELEHKQNNHNSFLVKKAIASIHNSIHNTIHKDLSLTEIAKSVYINPNYLSKIFKQDTGKSFIEYVIEIKMTEAKRLLTTSHYKIYEIADLLQYKDVNHFTKVFKKVYGVSPKDYRELA